MRRPPFLRFSFKRKGGCKVVRPAATLLFCPAVRRGRGAVWRRASGQGEWRGGILASCRGNRPPRWEKRAKQGLRLAIPEQNATICSDLATQAMAKEQRRGDGGEEETEETADGSRRAKEGGGRGTGGIAAGVNAIRRLQRGRCGGLWGRPSSRPVVKLPALPGSPFVARDSSENARGGASRPVFCARFWQ